MMDYRNATPQEHAIVRGLILSVTGALQDGCPSEDDYPGITGLIVTALVHVAGELLAGVPAEHRASVLAQYQVYLASAAGLPPTVQ